MIATSQPSLPAAEISVNVRRLMAREGLTYDEVVAATGLIMKRGHDLARVLAVLDKEVRLVAV